MQIVSSVAGRVCIYRSAFQDGTSVPVPFRFDVVRDAVTYAFKPDDLVGDAEAMMQLQPSKIGAIFAKVLGKLPTKNGRLVWECQLDTSPPATIRPRKPKMWFVSTADLAKGKSYLVD